MESSKKNSDVGLVKYLDPLVNLIAVLCTAYLGYQYIPLFAIQNNNQQQQQQQEQQVSNQNNNQQKQQQEQQVSNQNNNQPKLEQNLNVSYPASTNVNNEKSKISREFADPIQACWYYHAHYKNLYPYTVMWNISESGREDDYPKIRVIADQASWVGQDCVKEKKNEAKEAKEALHMKLIGKEEVRHRIEAQLTKESGFSHIATGIGNYRSELVFDDSGRIIERKVRSKEKETEKKMYKCIPDPLFEKEGIKLKDCNGKENNTKETDSYDINAIKIEPIEIEKYKNQANFVAALNLYVEKRNELHNNLISKGCGVVTVEPDRKDETKESEGLMKPSIVFLCYKDSAERSHVRVMVRN